MLIPLNGLGISQWEISQIAAPLTSMLWALENEPLAGEASVRSDDVGTKVGLVVAVR